MRAPRSWPAYAALGAIVVAGALLRLHNLHHGLPDVYHPDEAQHFTSRAIAMFGGDLNPRYFENPSAFTYLLYALLRVQAGWPFESGDPSALLVAYGMDPAAAYAAGRVLATILCTLAVVGVFAAGRRLWGPATGVAAAAVLAFAFLPVAYSRYSLTDTGVLLPVVLATYGAVRAWEDGRLRFYPTGHDRFTPSGARRNALSSLSFDMGLWERVGDDETPQLTDDGRAFVAEVFE